MKVSDNQARGAVRCLVNRARRRHGLRPLAEDPRLENAAQAHTTYMKRHGCFDHECAGEASVLSRLRGVNCILSGLLNWLYGENIAWGGGYRGAPKAIVRAWMHSADHRHNILEPRFESIGIGFARGTPRNLKANAGIYTTDFGMRRR